MNRLREIFNAGETAINGWLHIGSTWSAEALGRQGFDSLTIDLQHSLYWLDTAIPMIQAVSLAGCVPLVRVADNTPGEVMKVLDAGALGVICPMIENRAQCERFVGAVKYPPMGYRSLGPTRAKFAYGADYSKRANAEVLAIGMIETKVGFENLAEIVSTPGLDMIYIGPGDLCLTMGISSSLDSQEPEFLAAVDTIVAACQAHAVAVGIHTNSAAYAKQMKAMGMQFVTLSTDTNLITSAAANMIGAFKES